MTIKHFFEIYSPLRVVRVLLLKLAGLPVSPFIRPVLLRMGGVRMGKHCRIYRGVTFDSVVPQNIVVGNGVVITSGVKILSHFIETDKSGISFRNGCVSIGDGVFIGVNVVICNSVTIGEGAVIGAGSVVTKDVPAYQVWAGNPAHCIKEKAR